MNTKKKIINLILLITLFAFSTVVFANDSCPSGSPEARDRSRELLGIVFGKMGSLFPGAEGGFIPELFRMFNATILVIAAVIIIYTLIVATLNTAHEGQMMGKQWSSLWIPIRSALGIAMLLPTPAAGYSVIQLFFMVIILQGVTFANLIWGKAVDSYCKLETPEANFISFQTENMVADAFTSMLCMENLTAEFKRAGYPVEEQSAVGMTQIGSDRAYSYPIPYFRKRSDPNSRLCGMFFYEWPAGSSPADTTLNTALMYWNQTFLKKMQIIVQRILRDGGRRFMSEDPTIRVSVQEEINTALSAAAKEYDDEYRRLFKERFKGSMGDVFRNFFKKAKEDGWVMAGAYFMGIARVSNIASNALEKSALKQRYSDFGLHVAALHLNSRIGSIDLTAKKAIQTRWMEYRKNYIEGRGVSGNWSYDWQTMRGEPRSEDVINVVLTKIQDLFRSLFKVWQDYFTGVSKEGNDNVILHLQQAGAAMLSVLDIAWMASSVAIFGAVSLIGIYYPLGLGTISALLWIIPMLTLFLASFYAVGITMAYIVPLMPFVIFLFAALGWLVLVIETIVAAPLVALGLVHPEGQHAVFGKAGQSLMLLVSIFLRPTLLIFGFIISIVVVTLMVKMLARGFLSTVSMLHLDLNTLGQRERAGWLAATLGNFPTISGFVATIVMFTTMVVLIVKESLTLITRLPDYVLRWIESGPTGEIQSSGSQAMGSVQQVGEERGGSVGKGTSELMGQAQAGGEAVGKYYHSKPKPGTGDIQSS